MLGKNKSEKGNILVEVPLGTLVLAIVAIAAYLILWPLIVNVLQNTPAPEISFGSSSASAKTATMNLQPADQKAAQEAAAVAAAYIATLPSGCRNNPNLKDFLKLNFQDYLWDYFPPMSSMDMEKYMDAYRNCGDPNDPMIDFGDRMFTNLTMKMRLNWEFIRVLGREEGMKVIEWMLSIMVP